MNNQLPEDSFEKALEQGTGQDPTKNPLAQMQGGTAGGGSSVIANPLKAALSIGDPQAWVGELYGVPTPIAGNSAEAKEKSGTSNHTPLDMKKMGGKDAPTNPQHAQYFKKYREEYEQFLNEKKKKAENQKRQEEEDEKKKKEEEQKRAQESQQQDGGQGKQKQKLGQPRRKATTEQHPETKMGGAK